jgi:hypothetical protein
VLTHLRRTALTIAVTLGTLAGITLISQPATAAPAAPHSASGDFVAAVDFASLTARDVRGNKCEFTVNGTLTFSGTLAGPATGTTTAVIFAPCSQATTTPPGTFFDVFHFEGTFTGTVKGEPATGPLTYSGITRVGGAIDATVILGGGDARAVLRADAIVAVGGSYSGVARNR